MFDDWIMRWEPRRPLRQREHESLRIVKRISRNRIEAPIPHQGRQERDVQGLRGPSLVVRAFAFVEHAYNPIALDANSNGLAIAKSERRSVAAPAGIVIM